MLRYVARRAVQAVPLILGVIVLNFFIIRLAPGDPAVILAGEMASPEYVAQVRERLGLSGPLWLQMLRYLGSVARGDLGYSFRYKRPVSAVVFDHLVFSLILVGSAFLVAVALGTAAGILSARRPYSSLDVAISGGALVAYSVPNFWLAIMALLVFGVWLRWFPLGGVRTLGVDLTGAAYLWDRVRHAVLPVLSLGLSDMAIYARFSRASMLQAIRQDFIRTARAKGCTEPAVLLRHAARTAMIPVVTVMGLRIPTLFTGAVLVESVFAWPGMGRLMYGSIFERDYSVLMGIFIFTSLLVIVAALAVDIAYAWLDPRIRYGG